MKRTRGATLTECMVSLALILIAGIIVIQAVPSSRKGMQNLDNHLNAAAIGRSLLSAARAESFDAVTGSSGTVAYTGTSNGAGYTRNYEYKLTVQNVNADKKLVTAVVSWNESSVKKQVTLQTILANMQ